MIAFVFASVWLGVTVWAVTIIFGLLNWLGAAGRLRWPLAVLLLDVRTYAWHQL